MKWNARNGLGRDHPAGAELSKILVGGIELARSGARGRQVWLEERALEQIERIGAADDELTAPVDPIEEGLFLLGREWFARVDLIPEYVSDTRPGQGVIG